GRGGAVDRRGGGAARARGLAAVSGEALTSRTGKPAPAAATWHAGTAGIPAQCRCFGAADRAVARPYPGATDAPPTVWPARGTARAITVTWAPERSGSHCWAHS